LTVETVVQVRIEVTRRGAFSGKTAVQVRPVLTGPLSEAEWRLLLAVVRQIRDEPSATFGVPRQPKDAALDALLTQQPPRPQSQRRGGQGLKQWWEQLRRAAEGTPSLRGRWGTWGELRRYVEHREKKDREAEDRASRGQEWIVRVRRHRLRRRGGER
jgi:hypothetical protein